MKNYSRQREAIVRSLMCTESHPTAEEIYAEVKVAYPKISLATVYRNLRMLADEEEIKIVHIEDDKERYDAKTSPHAHLFCTKCGKIKDIDLSIMQLESLRTVRADDFELNFFGVCDDCLCQKPEISGKII